MSRIASNASGLTLSGELDLSTLMNYRSELQSHLPFSGDVVVDLSAVQVCGSAVLALLIYLVREARAGGHQVQFVGADASIRDMASLAGLQEVLHLTEEERQ